jgi:two-component system, OmpR family, sensor histidine kinase CreC
VKIRTRLSVAFVLLGIASVFVLVDWVLDDLRPRYLAAMEESMVDTATILATLVELQMDANTIPIEPLRAALSIAGGKHMKATIYEYTKTELNLRVYITDHAGIVLLDSDGGKDEGKDYSRWNDVALTLRGEYGARATHRIPNEPASVVLFVSAPLRHNGEIVGVLSVGKPATSLSAFLETATREIIVAGLIVTLVIVLLGAAVSRWVSWPVERLTRYAEAVRDDERVPLPPLGNDEIGRLGVAFEEMRVALAGKQYVEDYVQTLTHQLKSPVSALRGSIELLEEEMPEAERTRFYGNLRSEVGRMQTLIERMLRLASLENRQELRDATTLDFAVLIDDSIDRRGSLGLGAGVVKKGLDTLPLRGERFLLEQAIDNLLQNALDFAGPDGTISFDVRKDGDFAVVDVHNSGPPIPDYALDKIFDRFYSLTRPDSGKKSTGLGLPFVRNVATLHGGDVSLENRDGGVLALLRISAVL